MRAAESLRTERIVASYELRLFNHAGADIVYFRVMCDDDAKVREKLALVMEIPYRRFELWREADMIAEGRR